MGWNNAQINLVHFVLLFNNSKIVFQEEQYRNLNLHMGTFMNCYSLFRPHLNLLRISCSLILSCCIHALTCSGCHLYAFCIRGISPCVAYIFQIVTLLEMIYICKSTRMTCRITWSTLFFCLKNIKYVSIRSGPISKFTYGVVLEMLYVVSGLV